MPGISLTTNQLAILDREMIGLEILMPIQIFTIADEIEAQIRLPKLPTEERYKVICKIIKKIDRTMYQYIPNEYYTLINHKDKGIKAQEAEILRQRLIKTVINNMPIPILTEFDEEKLITIVINKVTSAMIEGNKL